MEASMKLHDLQEARVRAVTEMRSLADGAEGEGRDLSEPSPKPPPKSKAANGSARLKFKETLERSFYSPSRCSDKGGHGDDKAVAELSSARLPKRCRTNRQYDAVAGFGNPPLLA